MPAWLAVHWGTIVVSAFLIAVVFLIIMKMRKDQKQGKSTCGGNCAHCVMGGSCHLKDNTVRSSTPHNRETSGAMPAAARKTV
ncbi:MAG: FeoB-associated Cys-rich membrane protein [Eubacteriales bacterium]|jgi:hypothetical protein